MHDTHARIARYELPGTRWYFASCYLCRWVGLDWKHKAEAKRDRDDHNAAHHDGVTTGGKRMTETWTCPECGRVCFSEDELKAHALATHIGGPSDG